MFLGALADAGVAMADIQTAVDAVGVEPVEFARESVTRQGVSATQMHVTTQQSSVIRTWGNIRGLLEDAPLPEQIRWWQRAGIGHVRSRVMSLGTGVVIWGVKGGSHAA